MSVASVNERLAALTAAGTSVWLDQMSRGMIASGELARMVDEDSLRGVTSNPSIFEKSILGTTDYDEALATAAREGLSAREVYRRLAVEDVQAAADVLRPVYEASGGLDGYVSLEVAPRLAHDTEGTLEQARMYWGLVSRPNLMVKIPATEEGIPAIEQALYEGMNVNITLLFSVDWHRRVMEAFVAAMERRLADDLPLTVHSVASFFVSRVDTEVDRRLEALGRGDLAGRAALANARAAYRAYKEVFHGGRFSQLRDAGCPSQRPLWASTGVKNPRYPDTLYVDGLVGPECVNTMPMATLMAAAERGDASEMTVELDPQPDLDALREAGIDLDDVTEKLLRDGVEVFMTSMSGLIDGVERRREAVVTGRPPTIDADLPSELEAPVAERLRRAGEEDVARRIWQRDATVWGPEGTPELADRLGWLTIANRLYEEAGQLDAFRDELLGEGFTDALLLGMGGSSLAPEVFRRSYEDADGLRLHVLDTTEPLTIREFGERLDPERTVVVVSTKSGGTIETLSLFKHFWERFGQDGRRFVAVTDPGSGLAALAERHGFRRTFLNDPDIGGRYSALSYFGLVPAALAGVDVEGHLHGSEVAEQNCQDWSGPSANSGLWLGCTLGELALRGRDKLSFVVDAPLESFGLWVEQLIAESTGKQGKGAFPIADEPLGANYGDDRVFVHLLNDDAPDSEHAEFVAARAKEGHPTVTLRFHGAGDLGRIFFFSEFATAVAGWALGINPFDQPNVQEAKDNTARALKEPVEVDEGSLEALLGGLGAPSYVSIMGYLPYDEATDAAVLRLRAALLERYGVATTFGYGPRFLHSTGQYHKGGPAQGRFLQLVHDSGEDEPVPGEAFGFRTLIGAQADGDLATLRSHGLPAARAVLPAGDVAGGIDALTERVKAG
jgi:transaldolase/glucose-6-phosphate isomerase